MTEVWDLLKNDSNLLVNYEIVNDKILLEYKTGFYNEKQQSHVENYQRAIESMGYRVVKKALIYIGERVEIVNL